MTHPIRVLISKIGLDGHDRGAKLIVRHLRDAGMDVIYTGLWQTPAATVQAAIHEDVDVLGVSLLSAAHMTVMPEVIRLCGQSGVPDLPVVVGGIIPVQDHTTLREMGLAGIFNPGTSLDEITTKIREISAARRSRIEAEKTPLDIRTPFGLARAITRISTGQKATLAAVVPSDVYSEIDAPPAAIAAATVGVTGAPGVGKSTFIGKLARALRKRNRRVAVIAVDPTSPITGGAVLGDRLRMMSAEPDAGLFIRSLSSGDVAGGLAPHFHEILNLVSAAGYDVVLVETVGAGQGDTEVRKVTRDVFVLMMPGSGDMVQFFKAGIMEIATGLVVNKADLPGSDQTIKELRDALEDSRPIWPVSALRDEGFDPICDWIEKRK